MSLDSTDPSLLFGGTWERIEGRFLLAASNTYKAEETGGEATHKLTVAEMPSHSHSITNAGGLMGWAGVKNLSAPESNNGTITNQAKLSNAGNSAAHNNMPPYLSVYMWRRIS